MSRINNPPINNPRVNNLPPDFPDRETQKRFLKEVAIMKAFSLRVIQPRLQRWTGDSPTPPVETVFSTVERSYEDTVILESFIRMVALRSKLRKVRRLNPQGIPYSLRDLFDHYFDNKIFEPPNHNNSSRTSLGWCNEFLRNASARAIYNADLLSVNRSRNIASINHTPAQSAQSAQSVVGWVSGFFNLAARSCLLGAVGVLIFGANRVQNVWKNIGLIALGTGWLACGESFFSSSASSNHSHSNPSRSNPPFDLFSDNVRYTNPYHLNQCDIDRFFAQYDKEQLTKIYLHLDSFCRMIYAFVLSQGYPLESERLLSQVPDF